MHLPKRISKSIQNLVLVTLMLLHPMLLANVDGLKKEIDQIDSKIAQRKASLAKENVLYQSELEEIEKTIRSDSKRIERQGRKIERAQERLAFVQGSIKELDQWFNGLGAIDQGLNGGTYETKKNALTVDLNTAQSELKSVLTEKNDMEAELSAKEAKREELKKLMASSNSRINSDKQIRSLLAQRQKKQAELARAEEAERKQNLPPAEPVFKTYVYAISGKKGGEIEKTLKLKSWVESYGAKYIEANWNGINSSGAGGSMIQLLSDMDSEFKKIPKTSKVILIGYGLGGGAAVLAATEVAQKQNRVIDYLVTIDPMGSGESRMNAVYETSSSCQGRISPEQYLDCLSNAKKRVITSNVKNFYNRWQRESGLPIDAKDRMKVGKREFVLSTGKFEVQSKSTNVNQMRVFYNDKDAHDLLLSDAASELPKILLPHLR